MNRKARTIQLASGAAAWMVVLSLLVSACSAGPTAPADAPESYEPLPSGTSADPQRVEFQAEDGKKLVGYYYPSKYQNAPVVILMHWAQGDLCDWTEVALWLQNRRAENPAQIERCANPNASSWKNPGWFPLMDPNDSLAVFIFDFRGYGESEAGNLGPDLVKDAKAAFKTAAGFPGVDARHLAAVGASIGADAAADGCLLYNQEAGGGCAGAFSLSPGNYLGMQYAAVVTDLAPVAVLCAAGELDSASAQTCEGVDRKYYANQNYPGSGAHGMDLLTPTLDPSPMALIQVFVGLAFGEDVQVGQ
jgi:dienelactone hydrolase